MICADTSVWIAALRDAGGPEAQHLGELMDADDVLLPVIVRLELLAGAREKDQAGLRELLSALPQAVPDAGTWSRIEEWIGGAVGRGQQFGVGDVVARWEFCADGEAGLCEALRRGLIPAVGVLPVWPDPPGWS